MKVLIFLGHPAHFHLFKNTIRILNQKDIETVIVIKDKDILEKLCQNEGFEYFNILPKGNRKRSRDKFSILFSSGFDLLKKDMRLLNIVRKTKPDIMLGTEASITHVGRLMNIPSYLLNEDDAETQPEFCYPSYPFATGIIAPECTSVGRWSSKKISYNSYHELAYLSRKYFKPDPKYLEALSLNKHQYFIIRLVSLTASHDVGKKGLDKELLMKIIALLESHGRVLITSEAALQPEFEKYKIRINPNYIHHILAYAKMVIADSQTMIAEAAVLGIPSVRFSDFVGKLQYLEELEHKYGLTYGICTSEPNNLLERIQSLLKHENLETEWALKRNIMLNEKIELSDFLVNFIGKHQKDTDRLATRNSS